MNGLYAKYKEELVGEYENNIGVWNINVNNTTITQAQQQTFQITGSNIQFVNSNLVADNKMAPDRIAYFDILVDPTGTDVSIIYQIDVNIASVSSASLQITSVENKFISTTNEEETNSQSIINGNSIKGIIPLSVIQQEKKNRIRVYFKWNNVEANNASDSSLGSTSNAQITFPVTVNFKQYIGETLAFP